MKSNRMARGIEIFFWMSLALLVAVTQPLLGLLFLFLIPVWYFFAEVVGAPLPTERAPSRKLSYPELLVFSPRPPPLV
ncbi:MAG: hypothetical protein WBG02_03575 [Candidatus Acidiferrum sp.]